MKKKLSVLFALMLVLALLAPFSSVTAQAADKASIKLNKSVLCLAMGQKYTLKATVTGKSQEVTWTSSNSKVAKISKKGVITPVNNGRVIITASANGKKAKCTVTIYSSDLRLSDFRCESSVCGITMGTPYLDVYSYLSAGSYTAYYDFYQLQASQYSLSKNEVIKTLRGITIGMTKKDVVAAYGKMYTEEVFDKTTDKMYQIQTQSFGNEYFNGTKTLKSAKSVVIYNYNKNGNYDIRFYFNSSNKLISVIYTRNYGSFSNYSGWSHY